MTTPTTTPPTPPDVAPAGAFPLEAGELAARALDEPLTRLTAETLAALNQTWRDCVLADDDESRSIARRIVARLRRATHTELHPGCERVTIDVPQLPTGHFVRINAREYVGKCDVWLCEAQTILELVHRARAVDDARLRDDQRTRSFDLDRSALVARAALIQSA